MKSRVLRFVVIGMVVVALYAPVYMAFADCPNSKTKTIPCPSSVKDHGGCVGSATTCTPVTEFWTEFFNQPLESQANPGEDTKTRVNVDDDAKVTCHQTGPCYWNLIHQACEKMPFSADSQVNPLETVDC